jgi:hypothetical protein
MMFTLHSRDLILINDSYTFKNVIMDIRRVLVTYNLYNSMSRFIIYKVYKKTRSYHFNSDLV